MKRIVSWLAGVCLLMTLFGTPVAAAEEVPPLPHAFYGDVEIDGNPAPVGTEVEARGTGVGTGSTGNPITVTEAGKYGGPGGLDPKLVVQGYIEEGATITFYINNVSTEQTAEWDSGGVTELNLSVTITQPSPGPSLYTPPSPEIETNLFGTEASFNISDEGEILETIEATSEDGRLTITIPEGTIALDENGEPLGSLEAAVDESPADPPEDTHIIGLAYDLGPDGATFDPPITLIWTYDADALPEDVAEEDLVVAYYDEAAGEWVELDCVVDTENNTVTASVSHFTTFALIGAVTEEEPSVVEDTPASFQLSNLTVTPDEVGIGEEVQVSVLVRNTGDLSGSYILELKVNGEVADTKEISLAGHGSVTVSFTVTREDAGLFAISINGLTGRVMVTGPPAPPPPPEPVDIITSNLSVTPSEVETGETVTISVRVANRGGQEGTYLVQFKIDGVVVETETVTLAAGASQTVTFTTSQDKAGIYIVDIDDLSASFTVEKSTVVVPPGPNWPIIGAIIGGVVVAAGLLIFFIRRRASV